MGPLIQVELKNEKGELRIFLTQGEALMLMRWLASSVNPWFIVDDTPTSIDAISIESLLNVKKVVIVDK